MPSRRNFVIAAAAAGVGGAGVYSWIDAARARSAYDQAVQQTWRHGPDAYDDVDARMREMVRYATLAPSSHNTQCWKFRLAPQSVAILPDLDRRCPVVDPDDHHLYVSLGCATENLVQAASALGLHADARVADDGAIAVALQAAPPSRKPLFEAIPRRQTTRGDYDGKPLTKDELRLLESAGSGDGVRVILLTERSAMDDVLDFVVQGNTAQMRDAAFVREVKHWIRFNGGQAARYGDGLYAASSGNPVAPAWLGSLMFDLFFKEAAENDKYARHVRSSAGVAVFVSERDDRRHWVEAGRAFQRFALQATALGVRTAHLNQPVEVATLRPQFARLLGITSGRPDLVIRFGRGPELPRSLRRPVETVLLQATQ